MIAVLNSKKITKTFFLLTLLILSSVSCTSFPFQSFIDEQVRLYNLLYPKSQRFFKVENRRLTYRLHENLTAEYMLVFIHGSPGSWKSFAHFLKNKDLQRRFSLLAIDRPGYGSLDNGGVERNLKKQAFFMNTLVEKHKGNHKVILVGHSYGGPVVAQMAIDYPESSHGLVFAAASVDPRLEKTKLIQYLGDSALLKWLVPRHLDVCNQEILALKKHLEVLKPRWKRIASPVAIVHGVDDELVPIGNADFIKKQIAHKIVYEDLINKMNHFLPWAYPERIIKGIEKVIEKRSHKNVGSD